MSIFRLFSLLNVEYILNYLFFILIQAEFAMAAGSHQKSLEPLDELISLVRQNQIRLFLPDALHVRARVLRAGGRAEDARLALEDARQEAESLGSRRTLWPILAELGELAAGRGDQPAALELRRQAAEVIDYITEHTGSADLVESFVNQPVVQDVLRAIGRQPTAQNR